MYRRILVPIDGSRTSMNGLKHAIALAKEQRARVTLLNVIDEAVLVTAMPDGAGAMMVPELIDSLKSEGMTALEKARQLVAAAGVESDAVQIASRGQPVSAVILRQAKRGKADLIVMGTHGRRGLNRLLLGSDAERVLREATVPVLLTRQQGRRAETGQRRTRRPGSTAGAKPDSPAP